MVFSARTIHLPTCGQVPSPTCRLWIESCSPPQDCRFDFHCASSLAQDARPGRLQTPLETVPAKAMSSFSALVSATPEPSLRPSDMTQHLPVVGYFEFLPTANES